MVKLIVVIPTRNRINYLNQLLQSILLQTKNPDLVVIVDSSDMFNSPKKFESSLPIEYIHTTIRSAAIQRNIGLDYAFSRNFGEFIISFLDDDVEIPTHYLKWQHDYLMGNPHVVGLSGTTIKDSLVKVKNKKLLFSVGYSGISGSITKAAINISPKNNGRPYEVQWLIGCSTWKSRVIESLRFEDDFVGNSIFEDVIFSYRASEFGKLICAPDLKFTHRLAQTGRDSIERQYFSWIKNRYRIFKYNRGDFSKKLFWVNSILLALYHFSLVLIFHKNSWRKFKGLTKGLFSIVKDGENGKNSDNSAG